MRSNSLLVRLPRSRGLSLLMVSRTRFSSNSLATRRRDSSHFGGTVLVSLCESRGRGPQHVGEVATRRRPSGRVVDIDANGRPRRRAGTCGCNGRSREAQELEGRSHFGEREGISTVVGVGDERPGAERAANLVGSGVLVNAQHTSCATAVHGHLVLELSVPNPSGTTTV
jgi:hypothetical protein